MGRWESKDDRCSDKCTAASASRAVDETVVGRKRRATAHFVPSPRVKVRGLMIRLETVRPRKELVGQEVRVVR
jgi:hypothetical protein